MSDTLSMRISTLTGLVRECFDIEERLHAEGQGLPGDVKTLAQNTLAALNLAVLEAAVQSIENLGAPVGEPVGAPLGFDIVFIHP